MAMVPQLDAQRKDGPLVALGQYEILREIAAGGMATVYLGQQRGHGGFEQRVAIKCCHPHLRRDPAFVTMFLDEARLAAKIHHPNVVATLAISDDEALYFVMQYIEGTNLAEWIKQASALEQRIDESMLLRVMLDGLSGLHAAHELRDDTGKLLNLIHRDVSPHNLLIGIDGITRIADFGIAKAETRATRTRTGQVKGKTGYMSPEQILGEPMDRRADIYAAGVVLWEALAGKRLFDAESDAAIINQVLNARVPAPSVVSSASPCFDAIVSRALQFKPADRYATTLEFAQALEQSGIAVAPAHVVGQAIGAWIGERDANNDSRPLEVPAGAEPWLPEMQTGAIPSPQLPDAQPALVPEPLRPALPAHARSKRLLVAGLIGLALLALWLRSFRQRATPISTQVLQQPPFVASAYPTAPSEPAAAVSPPKPSENSEQRAQPPAAQAPQTKSTVVTVTRSRLDASAHPSVPSHATLTTTRAPVPMVATPAPSVAAPARKLPSISAAPTTPNAPASATRSKTKPSEFRPPDL